jgi:hypothetical protein
MSDVIGVIERAVSAQEESVATTTVMPYSTVYTTAKCSAQTLSTGLRNLTLLVVRHGNGGEGAV